MEGESIALYFSNMFSPAQRSGYIRPVVEIIPSFVDISSPESSSGTIENPWKLK